MRFLKKDRNSIIFEKELVYRKNNSRNNKKLNDELLEEQFNFCAYTERYVTKIDAYEVEHFNDELKYKDDYFNYYSVLRKPNLWKRGKEKEFRGASFFDTLFFQEEKELFSRIRYVKGEGVYEEIEEGDEDAESFIEYLNFNHPELSEVRSNHLKRLKKAFREYNDSEILEYFREDKEQLSFITAIEAEFEIDLSEFYTKP